MITELMAVGFVYLAIGISFLVLIGAVVLVTLVCHHFLSKDLSNLKDCLCAALSLIVLTSCAPLIVVEYAAWMKNASVAATMLLGELILLAK